MLRPLLPLLALLTASAAAAQASPAPDCTATGAPALWVVEDEDSRIYLFGTVAALPPDVDWYGPVIEWALADSDELVTEIAESDLQSDPNAVARLGLLPREDSLSKILGPERFAKVSSAATSIGFPPGSLDRLRPWTAALTLGAMSTNGNGIDAKFSVEQRLYSEAGKRELTASGLETSVGQLELFAGLPEAVHVAYLMQVASDLPGMNARLRRMITAWNTGDLCTLKAAIDDEKAPPEMLDVIMTGRNRTWADAIAKRMSGEDDLFVAVTAGHFVGPGNLIEQLAARRLVARRVQ